MKSVAVSEESRARDMPPDLWWDRKLELGPDDHLMLLAWWVLSMEIWQQDQRELRQRLVELEAEVARMKRKEKGKGKEKEDAEE